MRYVLVMYDIAKSKGAINAMQKTITLDDANKIIGEANATIFCDKGKYTVSGKRMFIVKETQTLYIIVDAEKQTR